MGMPRKRSTGDGALYYLADRKLWRGVVDAGYTLEGKRKQFYVTSRKQKDCRDKLEQLKEDIAKYGTPVNRKVTVAQWAETWLAQNQREVDPGTHATNAATMRRWILPTIGNRRLSSITPQTIKDIRAAMFEAGRKPATVNRATAVMSKFFSDAIDEKLLEDNPVQRIKRATITAESKRDALTLEDSLAILRTASQYSPDLASRFWFKLLTGQRQGEILGASLADLTLRTSENEISLYTVAWKLEELSWKHGCAEPCGNRFGRSCPHRELSIPDAFEYRNLEGRYYLTRPKSQTGRTVPLIAPLDAHLRAHLKRSEGMVNPHGLIWHNDDGSPIDAKQDAAEWRQLLLDAGIITEEENKPGGTKLTGHVARHTVVTLLSALGVDAQLIGEIVGHSSVDVTALYRHANMAEKARAMNLLGEALQLEV